MLGNIEVLENLYDLSNWSWWSLYVVLIPCAMYLEGCFDLRYLQTGMTGCAGHLRVHFSAFQSVCCVSAMFRVCVLMCTG